MLPSHGYEHTRFVADNAPGSRVVGAIVGFLSMFALVGLNIAYVVYLLIEKEAIEF